MFVSAVVAHLVRILRQERAVGHAYPRGGGVACVVRLVLQSLNINTAISPSRWGLIEDVGWCTGTRRGHL